EPARDPSPRARWVPFCGRRESRGSRKARTARTTHSATMPTIIMRGSACRSEDCSTGMLDPDRPARRQARAPGPPRHAAPGCARSSRVTRVHGDFELTMDELRVVARYVAGTAQELLPVFEEVHPDDVRPRAAVDAAREF